MQEITIPKKELYKHYVTIKHPIKDLCWSFCTRKRNISFGLFKERESLSETIKEAPKTPETNDSISYAAQGATMRNKYSTRNIDHNLIEIMPIAHYESSKIAVKGQYRITQPGT
jgi:hypothetical protein